jgi:hypothetical protein
MERSCSTGVREITVKVRGNAMRKMQSESLVVISQCAEEDRGAHYWDIAPGGNYAGPHWAVARCLDG